MDFSNTYGSLPHNLLFANFSADGFGKTVLYLIAAYLTNRLQRAKIGAIFSSYLDILKCILQGSILH